MKSYIAAAVAAISVATSAQAQTDPHSSPGSPQTQQPNYAQASPPPLPWSFPTPAPWTMPQGPQGQNPAPSQNPVFHHPNSAPSFDCGRAESASERAICARPDLSQLDRDISAAYDAVKAVQGSDYHKPAVSDETASAVICGQSIPAPRSSTVMVGSWQLLKGGPLCAGFVAVASDPGPSAAEAEYVYGKGTRLHLTGEYDNLTKAFTFHDPQGGTFIFWTNGSASFRGGSGQLSGNFTQQNSSQPAAFVTAPPKPALLASQRAWFGQRNACGSNTQCLQQTMSARAAELRKLLSDPQLSQDSSSVSRGVDSDGTGALPKTGGEAAENGATAAAQWKLPTRLGLPVTDLSNVSLDGLFSQLSDLRAGHLEWTRAIVALSLSLEPDIVAKMPPAAALSLACLYLPPPRVAALDAREYCRGIMRPQLGDEFKVRDNAAAFRSKDLPSILHAAPTLPLKLLFVMPLVPKPWDEKRGGFQVGEPSQSPPSLFGTPLLFKLPDFWPVPMPVARAFAESRRSQLVAPVYLAVPVIITGTTRPSRSTLPQDPLDPPLYFRTGLRAGANWEFEFEEMTLYGDAALTQKLHEFGRPLQPPKPIIGTPAAQTPHPAGPVLFDTETVILAASRPPASPGLSVDWAKAAESRKMLEVRSPLWARRDPWGRDSWGVFFKRRPGEDAKPDAAEITAFQNWTEARAKVMPGGFVFGDIPAYPLIGATPRRLTVFEPYKDPAWSGNSVVPFKSSVVVNSDKLAAALKRYGVEPAQVMPIDLRFAGIDVPVLAVLPRPRADYVLELPNGVPPEEPVSNDTRSNGTSLDIEVGIDAVEPAEFDDGQRTNTLVLVRVQPISATLRTASAGRVVASTSFPRMAWPAVSAAPPVLWPIPVPGPAEQMLAAPYGPDLYGVRLGMTLAEAEQEIRARMKVGRVLDIADPSRALADDERSFMRTIDGRMFVSDDFQNSVAVFTSRVAPTGRVVGVWHRTSADGDHWQKALQTLIAKYGPPVGTPGSGAYWGDRSMLAGRERSRCSGDGVGRYAWENWIENGHPVKLSPSGSGPLDGPTPPLLRDADIPDNGTGTTKLADCFPVVHAKTASLSTIETRLFDMRALALLRAQAASAPPRIVVAAAISINAPAPAPAPVDARLTAGPYGPDVVGLHLGMTFTEAEALLRTKMNVTLVAETTAPSGAEAGPSGLFHGKVFVGDDRKEEYFRERIAIFDAPAQAPGRVVAIERVAYLEAGRWDQATQQLLAKYGPVADRLSLSNWLVWLERGDENCLLRRSFSSHQWHIVDNDESRLKGPELQEVPLPEAPNLQAVYPRCGTVIEVIDSGTESGTDGKPLEQLHTRLYDTALLARLLNSHAAQAPNSSNMLPMKF